MEDLFYDNWLAIGRPEYKYKKAFPVVPLKQAESIAKAAALKLPSGFFSRHANRLRNGNFYDNFKIPANVEPKIKKISSQPVGAIYTSGGNLLVEHRGTWAIYDIASFKIISQRNWKNRGSSYFCFDSKFYALGVSIGEFSSKGELICETFLSAATDLSWHEAAAIGDRLVLAGYLTHQSLPDGLPDGFKPLGTLETVSEKGFSMADEEEGLQEIIESNRLAFLEEGAFIPIYLDDLIVQPLDRGIALLSYDLEIQRVLACEFDIRFVSAGLNGVLYVAGISDNTPLLVALALDGSMAYEVSMSFPGEAVCPPLITPGNVAVWVGRDGVAAFDENGEQVWEHRFSASILKNVYPLLYNDMLIFSHGSGCKALNNTGLVALEFSIPEGGINTPLVAAGGKYFIGTENGLFEMSF